MKRLLLITDAFPPAFSPRVAYLCRFLTDYEIVVVTEQIDSYWNPDFESPHVVEVARIPFFESRSRLQHATQLLGSKVLNTKDDYFYDRIIERFSYCEFDLVACFSYYLFPLRCAHRVSRTWNIPLVVDLRDVVEQWPRSRFKGRMSYLTHLMWLGRLKRNLILPKADAVVTVSEFHYRLLNRYNEHTHLIYNGYDNEAFVPRDVKDEKFRLSYIGRLYKPDYQNPSLLFEALGELLTEDAQFAADLSLDFYGTEISRSYLMSFRHHELIANHLTIHPYVAPAAVPELLWHTSVALVFTNESTKRGPHGVLTTKFFEAMGVEKPVLCVRSDEDELAQLIANTNAGMAARTIVDVKAFLLDKYHEWKRQGFTRQAVNQELKPTFSRQYQAAQFQHIFDSVLRRVRGGYIESLFAVK